MARPDPVGSYARRVVAGKVVAGGAVRKACARHLADVKAQKQTGLKWCPERATRALDFFREMLLIEDGTAFEPLPWQAFVLGSLFGWYTGDGTRRFRTAYIETGKGSGKTPLAAGVGLYGLVADGEPAPEIYSAATTRDQAKIVWTDAQRMVQASAELKGLVQVQVGSLTIPSKNATFRSVSSEHRGLDGLRPHIGLIDELHEHRDAIVVDKLRAGTKARRNALLFEITNSGYDRHSVCWAHHEYSLKVLEGVIQNDSWFAYVCQLDQGDDWRDPRVWAKANPSLPKLPGEKYLREQVEEAKGMPTKENIVRRLSFCEWTEQSDRAIPMEWWDQGQAPIDLAKLRGRVCYGGLDLARVNDLSAFALVFPPEDGEKWQALVWFWVPADDITKRSHHDRVPYDVWERQGHIIATEGNCTDFGFIQAKVVELAGEFQIQEIGFDRTFAGEIVQGLEAEGLTMVQFGQGFLSMAAPTAELLRLVKAGDLQHGGNPVLRWNASNLAVATDAAGNMKPDKEHSAEKIDGISALCFALGMAGRRGPTSPSVYEERGILTL